MFTDRFSISMKTPMENPIRTAGTPYAASALLLALALALVGCTSSPAVPTPGVSPSPAFRHGENLPPAQPTADLRWWRELGDERLAHLVERAAVANHDVRIAVERARQARAGTVAAESRLFPSIDVTASRSDSRTGLPTAVKQSIPDTQATRLGVEVGWEIDLFGGARAAAGAAEKEAAAATLGVSGAQLLTVSEVARQYFIWHGARQRLDILEALLQTQRDTERLVRSRHREGMASEFDVARAASESLGIEASLPQLRTLLAVTETRIAVLTGADASSPVPELHAAGDFQWTYPKAVLAGQPADLLRRRPDLLAAEQRLAAESSRLAESKANRFPKLFLSALLGRQDLTLNGSFSPPASRYSNVAAAFLLPVFNAGNIQAGIDAQSARERESLLSYEKTILGAIEDVENSLVALRSDQQQLDALAASAHERQKAVARATSLHREGAIDLLPLLDTQRARLSTELARAESNAQLAMGYVQLYKALGGGWQALPTPANAQTASNPN